jgi:hypothetical protein
MPSFFVFIQLMRFGKITLSSLIRVIILFIKKQSLNLRSFIVNYIIIIYNNISTAPLGQLVDEHPGPVLTGPPAGTLSQG